MSNSRRPTLRELRQIYLLIGECCELGADPELWRRHMMVELSRILGAQITFVGEVTLPSPQRPDGARFHMLDHGWQTDRDRQLYASWVAEGRPDNNPINARLFSLASESQFQREAVRLCEYMDLNEWHRSSFFNDFAKPMHLDDVLGASFSFGADGQLHIAGFIRDLNDKRFEVRQRRLLALFNWEIERLLGSKLAKFEKPSVVDLPPRMRQVLIGLLEGESEKQIASRLSISPHTVHEHVKRLHRHFKSKSRGELLARSHDLLRPLRRLREEEKFNGGVVRGRW